MYVDPPAEVLKKARAGDLVYLAPCASKPDHFGEEHCTFPSVLLLAGNDTCAARAIIDTYRARKAVPRQRKAQHSALCHRRRGTDAPYRPVQVEVPGERSNLVRAEVGTQQSVDWVQRAQAIQFDAVRTNNMVALDNSEAYALLHDHAFTPASS